MRETGHASSQALTLYLRSIAHYRWLTPEEEVAIARRAHNGDEGARNTLVCANLRFVVSIARKYNNRGVPLSDLINEGNAGLLRAVDRFDETRGVRFIAYAVWWIRQAILEALADQSYAVRLPQSRTGTIRRVARRIETLSQELGRRPTATEIAEGTQLSPSEIADVLGYAEPVASFDTSLGDTSPLRDVIADERAMSAHESVEADSRAAHVRTALAALRPREAAILRAHYGLDGDECLTLEQIGNHYGITRERVRQIKDQALDRLRRGRERRALASWVAG